MEDTCSQKEKDNCEYEAFSLHLEKLVYNQGSACQSLPAQDSDDDCDDEKSDAGGADLVRKKVSIKDRSVATAPARDRVSRCHHALPARTAYLFAPWSWQSSMPP